ncbi:UDP-glycosyltransferase UGT5-like isoform X1 [Pararge aegeria]|uniref:UDP-glycosyltransferase UGT5-like isoform X1 n=2 Tax=Pararge aegeria TaxID=116150 RepID=UPI0019D17079|nr:UDP-glycosyltransferase UGT5-like isoform X1 [Pararge aegeria]
MVPDIKMIGLKTVLFLTFLKHCTEAANILYVTPFTSTSHNMLLSPIGLELARRGHNVTVITSHREKHPPPNYNQVMVDDIKIWEVMSGGRPNVFTMTDITAEEFHHNVLWDAGLAFTEVVLNSTEVRDFLSKDNAFELVISEQFFQEALYMLAYKYNAPLALVTTFGNCMRHNIAVANPLQLATVLPEFLDVKEPGSFWGRLRSFYFTTYEYIYWRFVFLRKQEQLVERYMPYLPKERPSLYKLQQNCSLMLTNSHFTFDSPIALLPNIVEVGGLHLTRSNLTLPKNLQTLMDDSTHGIVYMNFGSNVRSAELPVEKKKAFLNVFRKLKQTVIWKWEEDILEDKPKNLVTQKWLPQKEILAHPNVKVFISHGGLIGTQEAIFNGVPLIGVPIYADQYNNLLLAKQAGFGEILQYHDINEETLEKALNDVINDEKYLKAATEVSRRFKDRPMAPLDTAMYWLEYVIRNNGAEFMKNPASNMSWIVYNMVDVYAFVLIILLTILLISVTLFSAIIRNIVAFNQNNDIKIEKIS